VRRANSPKRASTHRRARAATTPAAAPDRATALRGLAYASALIARALATETPLAGLLAALGGAVMGLLAMAIGSRAVTSSAARRASVAMAGPWDVLRYGEPTAAGAQISGPAPATLTVPLFTTADRRVAPSQ